MNCGQRAALLRLQSDDNRSGHLSLCLQQTSSPRSAKRSRKTSPLWLGCREGLREVRAPKARDGAGRGGGGSISSLITFPQKRGGDAALVIGL